MCYGYRVKWYYLEYILLPMKIQQPSHMFIEKYSVLVRARSEKQNQQEREKERERGQTDISIIAENWPMCCESRPQSPQESEREDGERVATHERALRGTESSASVKP